MMHWIRTLWGKAILFIACILSLGLLIASICGACFALGMGFYTESEERIFESAVAGNLQNEAQSLLWDAVRGRKFYEPNPNLIYEITDQNGKVLMASEKPEKTVSPKRIPFASLQDEEGQITEFFIHYGSEPETENMRLYEVSVSFKEGFPEADYYQLVYGAVHIGYYLRYSVYFIGFICLLAMIFSFIGLMSAAGRQPGSEELRPGVLNRVPFDLLLAVNGLIGYFICFLVNELVSYYSDVATLFAIILGGIAIGVLLLGVLMSVSARLKQKNLLKNTVICYVILGIGRLLKRIGRGLAAFFRAIPMVWRTLLMLIVFCLAEFIIIGLTWWESDVLLVFWFFEKLLLLPAVLWIAITLRKLQKGGDALARGDLGYHTDTKGMFWDFKRHGENLNGIARGMGIAVEKQLKSERMKTELITNVSHDIKTPLTSIINYAGLIEREPCENETVREYAGVLSRQSVRLKRLLEDLLEASKASSGNLEVNPEPCDATVFLTQVAGEHEERLEANGLQLITARPDAPVMIAADGRRMWRIFDNLMHNICKYAMPQTRVYLALEQMGDRAVITFKNTSREALNISEEELMERFVRGDAARHTEGNGLGLSIARSLAELQGGTLNVSIDGDLFKAILSFPLL